jgi:hypothetical protein
MGAAYATRRRGWDEWVIGRDRARSQHRSVPDDIQVLARLLAMAALLASTIEYAEIIHRRGDDRRRLRDMEAVQAAGNRALMRIRLMDRI